MKKLPLVLTLAVVLAAGLTYAPRAAVAGGNFRGGFQVGHGGFHGGAGGFHGGGVFVGRPFVSHHPFFVHRPFFFHHPFFFHRPFFFGSTFVGPFVPFGFGGASTVVVSSSPDVGYTPPPVAYAPPQVAYSSPSPAPAPPPMPTVIQYPHGRQELRGDGITTPYTWVWIPNPPPPPPPPATPPAAPPAEPQSKPRPAPGRDQIYSWTDAQGVTIWTNLPGKTPDALRAQAKRLQAAGI